MPLDQCYVGRSYPPTDPYEISREKIREFAEAVGDPHPAYTDPAAAKALGHCDVIAPPTFAFAVASRAEDQVIEDPQLGLEHGRVVHGAQGFAYSRPVRAGDRLSVISTVESIKSLAGHEVLDIRGEIYDDKGEHVVTTTTRLVARAVERRSRAATPRTGDARPRPPEAEG